MSASVFPAGILDPAGPFLRGLTDRAFGSLEDFLDER
jgi:hypothetical protein